MKILTILPEKNKVIHNCCNRKNLAFRHISPLLLLSQQTALISFLEMPDSVTPSIVEANIDYFPGFWFLVGLLVISGVMSWLGMLAAAFLTIPLEIVGADISELIMFPIGAVLGFIPVFIYGAWLGAQLNLPLKNVGL